MKRIFMRNSVIVAWVLSYVAILALPLSINLIANIHLSNSLKAEAYDAADSLLRETKRNVETRLNDIAKIAQLIDTNSNIERLLRNIKQEDYPADELNRIMVDLRGYQSSSSLIKQIYIVAGKSDLAISCGSVLRGAQFDRLMEEYRYTADGEAYDLRNAGHYGELRLFRTKDAGGSKTVIGLVQTLSERNTGRIDATLMILMDRNSLLSNLDAGDWLKKNPFYILNDKSELVAASAAAELPEGIDYEMLGGQESRFELRIGKQSYTVMQAGSYVSGWKYFALISNGILFQEFRSLQRLMGITTAAAIAAGIAVVVFLSRRNYLPLKNLINAVENETGRSFTRQENEFLFIKEATEGMSSERSELNRQLDRQLAGQRAHFLARLMKNDLPEELSLKEAYRAYDIHFVSEHFLVLVACIPGAALKTGWSGEMRRKKLAIRELFEQSINRENYGFVTEVDDMLALIVNLPVHGSPEEACLGVYEQVEKDIQYLESNGVAGLTVASSDCVHAAAELPHAYADAYTAVEYSILMNRTGLSHHKDIAFGMENEGNLYYYYYPLQVEMQLTNAIKSGGREQAQRVLDELFRVNFEQCSVPQAIARCFMFNLTSTIIRIIYELNLTSVGEIENSISTIESLLNCSSIPEIKGEMDAVIEKLCAYTRDQWTQDAFQTGIQAFVKKNYANADLDIPMIAEHLSLTPSYLSKKFKSLMGVGLLDYINKYRAEKAAERLCSTQDSISKIAEACGFMNSNTFIRVFKKCEGVTPGKYREISCEHAR